MRKIVFLTIISVAVFIFGCGEPETTPNSDGNDNNYPEIKLEEQFNLKCGQTITINTVNIKVKFLEVTEDSRCPSDVVCVWAGQVSALLNVNNNGNDIGNVKLTLGQNKDDAVKDIGGYYLKLIDVKPYPISTQKIEKSDYIVTLMISKYKN